MRPLYFISDGYSAVTADSMGRLIFSPISAFIPFYENADKNDLTHIRVRPLAAGIENIEMILLPDGHTFLDCYDRVGDATAAVNYFYQRQHSDRCRCRFFVAALLDYDAE